MKNIYSQLTLDNATSQQYNFSIVVGDITGTYRFLTGFYGLDDKPNEFQRVMDTTIGSIPFTTYYIDDILIGSKGSHKELKDIVNRVLSILDS